MAFQLQNLRSLLFFRECLSKTVYLLWHKNEKAFFLQFGRAKPFVGTFLVLSRPCLSVTALNDRHAHGREKQEQTLFKDLRR